MSVRRIYVEKKRGFDVEAQALMRELAVNLRLSGLSAVRVLNRYDVENLDDDTFEAAKRTVFSESAVDTVYCDAPPLRPPSVCFGCEYLPGQYDQRADSAVQCIRLIKSGAEPAVRFARIIVLEGDLEDGALEAAKRFVINPVDSREASPGMPATLETVLSETPPVETLHGFGAMDADALESFRASRGLAMGSDDIRFVQGYFRDSERRDPSVTELRVIDAYWSDHCRHTTFNARIGEVRFAKGPYADLVRGAFEEYLRIRGELYGEAAEERGMSLMDIAVIGAKYLKMKGLVSDLDESDETNACSVRVKADVDGGEEDWLVMFKNETHNHPTEIEPFGGAATCLGGAIRDPLSGRAYVYQAMRVTGSGDPRAAIGSEPPGKLPQFRITKDAARGYSSYGNQIGIATGQVAEIYDEGYVAKRMEIGAVIGAAPASHVRRAAPAPGDLILLVGGRTGRDGCGGATGSSKGHTEASIAECGAEVQKGNPPVERNLQRLFRRKDAAALIKRCNDFGAGGVAVAIGELADSIDVNLDLVPRKYEGLDGTELAISESQERMAVLVDEGDAGRLADMAAEENLEATVVAKVTDTGRFRMFWRDAPILDLGRDFLAAGGVRQEADVYIGGGWQVFERIDAGSIKKITEHLENLNCCSQKGLVECFDSTIGAGTLLMPLGGRWQATPAMGMAAKLPVESGDTMSATLMAYGFDPHISKTSPFHGALYAVVDSVTKIVAMGGDRRRVRLTFQEYFERLGKDPEKWGRPFAALLGALKAQIELGIPAIGGKDSMSGSFMDMSVPPTLVSFAVCVSRADRVLSPEFKQAGSKLVLIDSSWDDSMVIDFDGYRRSMDRVAELIAEGRVLSASTVGRGGIFIAVAKMAAGNRIGAYIDFITERELHEQSYGALILEVDRDESVRAMFGGVNYRIIGYTTQRQEIAVEMIDSGGQPAGFAIGLPLDDVLKKWRAPLEGVFPTGTGERVADIEKVIYRVRSSFRPAVRTARPRALIPVFPGTNCEADSRRAFERAGAEVTTHVLRNLTPAALDESMAELAKKIASSNIIMIPGGFSGGDEPDGSAKFITAVFRNPAVREAVTELMECRDGLMLGICNGFQALIKLGLLPFGRIADGSEDSPTLTYNSIGRHVSCIVRTRVASVLSPWLAMAKVGDIHAVPVSHGEGRFIASDELIDAMIGKGQIATQYVNLDGTPTNDIRFNPNNSCMAVEGISSPDGRIFGKMGHSERTGAFLYRNVEGNYDQRIFESGVAYFR
ncbi:MAG: phosphoribosylformylglycinamidine synthase [Clostridiales Family XIII bacterium]|jgi:phosphoribosylformylglycinamidine synthase|nr:phosphoribosylformylglycinamidine synthase [Clostridiales Family XIII bacterium]